MAFWLRSQLWGKLILQVVLEAFRPVENMIRYTTLNNFPLTFWKFSLIICTNNLLVFGFLDSECSDDRVLMLFSYKGCACNAWSIWLLMCICRSSALPARIVSSNSRHCSPTRRWNLSLRTRTRVFHTGKVSQSVVLSLSSDTQSYCFKQTWGSSHRRNSLTTISKILSYHMF